MDILMVTYWNSFPNTGWRSILWFEKPCVGRVWMILGQSYKEGTRFRINGWNLSKKRVNIEPLFLIKRHIYKRSWYILSQVCKNICIHKQMYGKMLIIIGRIGILFFFFPKHLKESSLVENTKNICNRASAILNRSLIIPFNLVQLCYLNFLRINDNTPTKYL